MTHFPNDKRLLGVDFGTKRMGLALWNPESQLTTPLDALQRKTLKHDLKRFGNLLNNYHIDEIVVGLPISLGGKVTPSTKNAQFWADKIQEEFNLPVHTFDESLSTIEAKERLAHVGSKKRKELKDSMSAVIILESFLNAWR